LIIAQITVSHDCSDGKDFGAAGKIVVGGETLGVFW